jgi:hypothetical protein
MTSPDFEQTPHVDVPRFEKLEWHGGTPGFRRSFLRAALRDLWLLLLVAVVAELFLRAAVPELRRSVFTTELTGGHPKTLNSYGLRDREFPRARPDGETRVLCLGNSTTYGSGVALEATYAKQLERLLATTRPTLVVNAGGEGTSIGKALRFLERDGFSFDPQLVIVGFSPAVIDSAVRKGEVEATRPLAVAQGTQTVSAGVSPQFDLRRGLLQIHTQLYASYAYVFWDTRVRRTLYQMGVIKGSIEGSGAIYGYAFDSPNIHLPAVAQGYTSVAAQLGSLQEKLRERGIGLVVLGIPSRFELSTDPRDNERSLPIDAIRIHPSAELGNLLSRRGIEFIDVLPRLRRERAAMLRGEQPFEPLYIEGDYSHLDEKAHELVAQELRAFLQERALL